MYNLLSPKFRFALYLLEENKFKNQNQLGQPTICHADTYEILDGGALIFYQIGITSDNKKVKVPVLSYPSGKWIACVLIDDKNQYPVFNNSNPPLNFSQQKNNNPQQNINNVSLDKEDENNFESSAQSSSPFTDNDTQSDDLDALTSMFSEDAPTPSPHNHQNNHWNRNNQHNNIAPNMPGLSHMPLQGSNMPGITQTPEEFKKLKSDFLEHHIKEYVRANNIFIVSAFESFINKNPKARALKVNEVDIVWVASNLIRAKSVLVRKFSEPIIQKTLALILPDIMRRQWSGKMGPILQILQEREETKNVNAIDIAVWMVQNGYE